MKVYEERKVKDKFYITTAIAYTSGKPHIGNTYEAILADSVARFKRYEGYDVFFQTGTDEHGQKIEEKAAAANLTPKAFVDGVAEEIKRIWDLVGVSYDKFIRTTDDYHEKQVQKIFKKLYEQGDIYKGSYEGWYCTPCESFWTESQLVDGKCPDCGREVKKSQEEAYFFKMSKYADQLMQYYNDHPEFILPISRKNEMVNNFLKPGLQDLCVSRSSFKWGIPVDFDSKHVVYVWLDALTNYITGVGYDADGNSTEQYNKLWPADVHIIGKDIIRFHTIYWPIFLMALGVPLPKKVYGHGWLLQDGGKMSKSKGNVMYADDLVEYFGKDAVRYYVLTAMPQDNDGLISWEGVIDTINSDLANVYGNLVSRTIAMSNKYFGGIVEDAKVNKTVDDELKAVVTAARDKIKAKMDEYRIADAIAEVISVFRRANKYIDETMPWALAKDESKKDRLKTVLYNLTEAIIIGSSLLTPFMPDTCKKVADMIGAPLREYDDANKFGLIDSIKVTETPEILFARLDSVKVMEKVNAMIEERREKIEDKKDEKKDEKKPEVKLHDHSKKEPIDIDDFGKVELKIAKVIACEKVEKSKKLLKLTVKVGEETRTVVSGIALYYTPEELVGKKLAMITNLKPCKLCGIVSEGMIVCAEDENGNIAYLTPEKDIADGSMIF
ncbi:MAG: methionine--tRNA ligase [Clostridiales bacterium]|nr:methionine--tRNA ligase [Clostridiales bacterium]